SSAQPEADAEAPARRPVPGEDRTGIPFVTIDPPGSMDLDQAVHLESRGAGIRVRYAIAAVGRIVQPGSALDAEVRARGVTVYGPGHSFPLHPRVLSADAASLLPDAVRGAYLWIIDLDDAGAPVRTSLELARVRSVARLTYDEVQGALDTGTDLPAPIPAGFAALFERVGTLRQRIEVERGGVSLDIPEQIVERDDSGGYRLDFRGTVPAEGYNAQISLLTGMEAARLMREAGIGVFRTLPDAQDSDVKRLRRCARALELRWPNALEYPDFVRSLDSSQPTHAAFLDQATSLFRGAGYEVFDDGAPDSRTPHGAIASEYAHVTAPLRRLVDRFGLEICLAYSQGTEVPGHIRSALPDLPEVMAETTRRANAYERGAVDVMEALVLAPHLGREFDAVVVDVDDRPRKGGGQRGTVMLERPAVEAFVHGEDLPLGEEVRVRLLEANPASRTVRFELA
ncbi:MAG: RNB domain-containing ribonuclease, partial [Actinomycetota bacterium]